MSAALLEVSHFTAGYKKKDVVRDVSFALMAGEVVGLLGLNGCGKTTLLRALCALVDSTGDCAVQGRDPRKMKEKERARRISYIPQRGSITLPLSLLDVVLMGFYPVMGLLEHTGPAREAQAVKALEKVGLADLAGQDFLTLSEGQRQLGILARALVQNTPLLLLDEPDSALDFVNRHRVLETLGDIARGEGKAVLISMHDANFALRYCSRLLLMAQGRLVGEAQVRRDDKADLSQSLALLYGEITLLEHEGHYVMVRA